MKRCIKPYVKHPDTGKCTKNENVIEIVKCRKKKVKFVMDEYKNDKLKTSNGKKVNLIKQALAIALSSARKFCNL